jgi:hypothetical protein
MLTARPVTEDFPDIEKLDALAAEAFPAGGAHRAAPPDRNGGGGRF